MFMDVYADTNFLLAIPYCWSGHLHNDWPRVGWLDCPLVRSLVINPLMAVPGPEISPIMMFASAEEWGTEPVLRIGPGQVPFF